MWQLQEVLVANPYFAWKIGGTEVSGFWQMFVFRGGGRLTYTCTSEVAVELQVYVGI